MPNFLFIYYGGMMNATAEQQKKSEKSWMAWFKKIEKSLVEMGAPTKPGKVVDHVGAKAVAINPISGYSVVNAVTLEAAVTIAKGCPIMGEGGKVEVSEIIPM